MKMLTVAVVIVLLLLIGAAVGLDRRASRTTIDSLVTRVEDYQLDSADHATLRDSLARVQRQNDSLAHALRLRSGVARLAAVRRDSVATAEVKLVETSLTAQDSASHWRAAYLARTEEADTLKRALAVLDSAWSADSVAKRAIAEALRAETGRRERADSLVIDLRGALEEMRPSWTDRVVLAAGLDYGGRPTVMLGVEVGSLSDVVKRLPRWMR